MQMMHRFYRSLVFAAHFSNPKASREKSINFHQRQQSAERQISVLAGLQSKAGHQHDFSSRGADLSLPCVNEPIFALSIVA